MTKNQMTRKVASILSLVGMLGFAGPALASSSPDNGAIQTRLDQMLAAVNARQTEQVSLYADRFAKDVATVMRLNGITRESAIARVARALISQTGNVPRPLVLVGYGAAYDPATHAFRQANARTFYAGVDDKGNHQFEIAQRQELRDDFWYCAKGYTYSWTVDSSSCK